MHKLFRSLAIVSLSLVFGAVAANAQSLTKVEAEVPFAFSVGQTKLAPGKYDIRVNKSSAGTATVQIAQKGGSGMGTALGLVNGNAVTGRAELVFDRYGDARVLRQITFNDNGISIGGRGSRKVRLARNATTKPETETVALN
jgi:hypothetical protein